MRLTIAQIEEEAARLAERTGHPLPEACEIIWTATGFSRGDVETRDEHGRLILDDPRTLGELLVRGAVLGTRSRVLLRAASERGLLVVRG